MKYLTTILITFFITVFCNAQDFSSGKQDRIDSLIIELSEKHPDSVLVDINFKIANEFYLKAPNKALQYAIKAKEIAISAGLHEETLESYNWIGYIYWQQGKLQKALGIYKTALKEVREEEYNDISIILNNIGYVYKDLGDFENALSYLQQALEIREEIQDSVGLGNSYNNIGLMYKDLSEYDKALEYLEKSYNIYITANSEDRTGNVLNNIAIIWSNKGELDKSRSYLLKALKVAEDMEDYNSMGMILDNIGANFLSKDQLDSASFYFEKSIETSKAVNGLYWQSSALLHMGKLMILKNNINEAKEYTIKAYEIAKNTGYPERLRDISEQLSNIFEKVNDTKNALKYHKEYILMRDSVNNIANKKLIFKQAINYEYEKKKLADSLVNIETQNLLSAKLDKEKSMAEIAKKEKRQNLIWSILAGVILILAVTFLLIVNSIRKKSNKNLSIKNEEISQKSSALQLALEERNTLLKEIHHRVKNNLQTVSSLLSLQSHYLDDPSASKVLEESRNRLNSISLLHQKLYQNDNLPVVVLKDYIQELTGQIMETCSPMDKDITLKLFCDEVTCDIERAMPIGLIINELMTNAYKYAFNAVKEGMITISLKNIEQDKFLLSFSDNGNGLPKDYELKERKSMGLNLVSLLTRQMKGKLKIENENGARFLINFEMKKK